MCDFFVVYSEHLENVCDLSDEQAGQILKALLADAKTGDAEPPEDLAARMVFRMMKAQADRSRENYERKVESARKSAEARWSKRGEMRTDANACERIETHMQNDAEDMQTDADECINKHKHKQIEKENSSNEEKKKTRFIPPTLEEVRTYINEHGYRVDAERFIDFYTSNGWRVGKNPMKDWRACIRGTWAKREPPSKSPPNLPAGRSNLADIAMQIQKAQKI